MKKLTARQLQPMKNLLVRKRNRRSFITIDLSDLGRVRHKKILIAKGRVVDINQSNRQNDKSCQIMFPSTLNQLYANYNIFIGSLLAKFYSLKKQIEIQLFREDIVDVLLLHISRSRKLRCGSIKIHSPKRNSLIRSLMERRWVTLHNFITCHFVYKSCRGI